MTDLTLTTTCRTCGNEYEIDRAALLRGKWRDCPTCRESYRWSEPPRKRQADSSASAHVPMRDES